MSNTRDLCRYYYSLTHSLTFIPDSRDLGTREGERERKRKKSHKRKERNSDSSNKQRTSF